MATVATVLANARYDLQDFGDRKYSDTQLIVYLNRAIDLCEDILIQLDSDFTKTYSNIILSNEGKTASLPTRCDVITDLWQGSDYRLIPEPWNTVQWRMHQNETITQLDSTGWTASGNEYYQSLTSSPDTVLWNGTALTEGTYGALVAGQWGYDTTTQRVSVRNGADPADHVVDWVAWTKSQPSYWSHDGANICFDCRADQDYTLSAYYHVRSAAMSATSDTVPYNGIFDEFFREYVVALASKAKDDKTPQVDNMYRRKFEKFAKRTMISRNFRPKHYKVDF